MDIIEQNNSDQWIALIIDQLTGVVSDENRALLVEWRTMSDENERFFIEMQKMWDVLKLSNGNKSFNEHRAYHLFKERVFAETGLTQKVQIKRISLARSIASYAAILLPLMILSYFTFRYFASEPEHKNVVTLSEVNVPNGSKTQLKLKDGTMVWLNSGSKVQYDSDFGETNRNIHISGEAYFEVTKNENLPFVVKANNVEVKVLGTCFNVNAYERTENIQVALLQGRVEMSTGKDNAITLKPGELACYNTITEQVSVSPNATKYILDWMDNRLIFNGESFEKIAKILERNFNVEIKIYNRKILNRQFAGDFVNNETIEQILRIMSTNGNFKYQITGNVVEIR